MHSKKEKKTVQYSKTIMPIVNTITFFIIVILNIIYTRLHGNNWYLFYLVNIWEHFNCSLIINNIVSNIIWLLGKQKISRYWQTIKSIHNI